MLPAVTAATPTELIVNDACDCPAATVTPAGTVAALFVVDNVTVVAAGAVELSVTVPVELPPPVTPAGKRDRAVTDIGSDTVITPTALAEFAVAVMFTAVFTVTADVVIVKFALIWPAATVTDAGTFATAGLLLESETTSAEVGAFVRYTVPAELKPPICALGEMVTVDGLGDPPGGITSVDAKLKLPRSPATVATASASSRQTTAAAGQKNRFVEV
jgi:hypothetical protein